MPNKAVFLDRDNTLIDDPGYINSPDQVKLLEGVPEALTEMRNLGYKLVVITNQSAVARGIVTEEVLATIHTRLEELLSEQGTHLDRIYYCPYHVDGVIAKYRKESDWRKPNPGMILKASQEMDLDISQSWCIGDRQSDIEAGYHAGCRTILIDLMSPVGRLRPEQIHPDHFAVNIREASNIVKKNRYIVPEIKDKAQQIVTHTDQPPLEEAAVGSGPDPAPRPKKVDPPPADKVDMPQSAPGDRATLGVKIPSSARERAILSAGKDGEAGDVGSIVDAAGCSQATNKPLEARGGFQTEARIKPDRRLDDPLLLRAVKILFHTDTDAIRTQFRRDAMQLDQAAVHRLIESALTQLDILNHRLMTVRLHHQLTHIQVQGYRALVKSLAYDDPKEMEPAQQKETAMSNPVKIYTYQRCGTCRKALKYLVDKGIEYHDIPIRETPPRKTELKTMLKHLDGRRNLLFNTSGADYRELKIKDQLAGMTDQDAIDMLNSNGNLVKRPFLLTAEGGLVGFKQDQWDAFF